MNQSPSLALEDFDVTKYTACCEWGAREWLVAITMRAELRHFLRSLNGTLSKVKLPAEIFSNEQKIYLEIAEERLRNPLIKPDSGRSHLTPVILRDLQFADAIWFDEVAGAAKEAGLEVNRFHPLSDVSHALNLSYDTFFIGINLYASDAIIKEKFSNWLRVSRNRFGITEKLLGKMPSKNDFDSWHSQKLLPFLDLIFWSKLSGHHLTQDEIGNHLFPVEERINFDPRDRIRSIGKSALRLIDRENSILLAAACQTY